MSNTNNIRNLNPDSLDPENSNSNPGQHESPESPNTDKPRKPRTAAQAEASRRNAQKSTGPRSIEGKKRASMNALKHGLRANPSVFINENQAAYDKCLNDTLVEWQPVTPTEIGFCVDIADCRFRIRRIRALFVGMFDSEMCILRKDFDEAFRPNTPNMRHADALMAITIGNKTALEAVHRAEAHFTRVMERALRNLIRVMTLRLGHPPVPQAVPENLPIEAEKLARINPATYIEPEVFSNFSLYTPTTQPNYVHRPEPWDPPAA